MDTVRFWDTSVEDCRFDGSRCQHVGLVRTEVTDCSFVGADFRQAALGIWAESGNVLRRVTFGGSDFRVGSCPAATFIDCDFSQARIEKVDFQSSSFVRCRFAGELREVMFYDHWLQDREARPEPNGGRRLRGRGVAQRRVPQSEPRPGLGFTAEAQLHWYAEGTMPPLKWLVRGHKGAVTEQCARMTGR
jgi:hypothetical protein